MRTNINLILKEYWIFILVLILAFVLRITYLDTIPNGFYVDEAAIAYNGKSFLQTGADEFGKKFPIFLRSYGMFSSPVYSYLLTFLYLLLGVTVFSTRLLSVIFGTLSVVLVYLWASKVNPTKEQKFPLITTIIFSLSPWTIFFSRGAFEVNVGFAIFMLGSYLLVFGKNRSLNLFGSALLGFTIYAYHAFRIISPLFFLGFLFLELFSRKANKKNYLKQHLSLIAIFVAIQIPLFTLISTPAFSHRGKELFYKDLIFAQAHKIPELIPFMISSALAFIREYLALFISYFSPRNLFFANDPDLQRSIPDIGVFYDWMVIPYLIGLYQLFKYKFSTKSAYLILLILVSPIAASFSSDHFSALRSLPLSFGLSCVIAIGVSYAKNSLNPTVFKIGVILLILFSSAQFLRSYFVLFPYERAHNWNYGYKELSEITADAPNEHFLVDSSRGVPSYILIAFYNSYDPHAIQKNTSPDVLDNYYSKLDFNTDYLFSNVETRSIEWENDIYKHQIIVGDELSISKSQADEHFLKKRFEIKSPTGDVEFVGYETDPRRKCESDPSNINCREK